MYVQLAVRKDRRAIISLCAESFPDGGCGHEQPKRAHQRQPRHGQHLAAYNVQEKTIPFLVNDGLFAWALVRGAVNKEHMCELLVGCSSRRVLAERFKNHKR